MASAPAIVAHRQLATCSRNRRCAPPSDRSALERLPVLARDHCNEVLQRALPMSECALGACAPGVPSVLLYQLTQYVAVAEIRHARELDQSHVALLFQLAELVQHERDPATHSGAEIPTRAPKHDDGSSRHVLTTVIADAFHHCDRSAVSHREALAGDSG